MKNRFTVSVDTGNAAFDDGEEGAELARILRDLADRIESRACVSGSFRLFDINGNPVGEARGA